MTRSLTHQWSHSEEKLSPFFQYACAASAMLSATVLSKCTPASATRNNAAKSEEINVGPLKSTESGEETGRF